MVSSLFLQNLRAIGRAKRVTMKLALVTLTIAVAIAAAIDGDESTEDILIKICDDDLTAALQEACTKKSVNYLLEHGIRYDKQYHKHQQNVLHLDHGHSDNHDHSHGHENHNQAKIYDNDSILDKCCHNPCLVKEFVAFCGED